MRTEAGKILDDSNELMIRLLIHLWQFYAACTTCRRKTCAESAPVGVEVGALVGANPSLVQSKVS